MKISLDTTRTKSKQRNLFYMLCGALGCISLGVWMLLDPSTREDREVEKASIRFINDIWGLPAGLTFLALGAIWTILAFIQHKYKRALTRPQAGLRSMIYTVSINVFKIVAITYAVIILQEVLSGNNSLLTKYAYSEDEMGTVHMVCIMFIIFFGIPALITGIQLRKRKGKAT